MSVTWMLDDDPTPTTRRSTAWLAAFALGLASSDRDDDDCVLDLIAVADGSAGRLAASRRRVRQMYGDRGRVSERAQALLDRAATDLAVHVAGPSESDASRS